MRYVKIVLVLIAITLIFGSGDSSFIKKRETIPANTEVSKKPDKAPLRKRIIFKFAPGTPLALKKVFFIKMGVEPVEFDVFGYDVAEGRSESDAVIDRKVLGVMRVLGRELVKISGTDGSILEYQIESLERRPVPLAAGCLAPKPDENKKAGKLIVSWYDERLGIAKTRKFLAGKEKGLISHGVVIVDSGVALTHPDIIPALKKDGEGKPIFWARDRKKYVPGNHGTHVACLAGAYYDGRGMDGVAGPAAYILPVAINYNDSNYYFSSDIAIGLKYYRRLEDEGVITFRVVNMSFGVWHELRIFRAAIKAMPDKLFAVAAGNENYDMDRKKIYPASWRFPNVIAVAASNNKDELADFSNHGKESVDIAAPGNGIISCVVNGGYENWQGTSMASPLVAGTATLIWSLSPDLDVADAKRILFAGADVLPSLKNKVKSALRLNVYEAALRAYKER